MKHNPSNLEASFSYWWRVFKGETLTPEYKFHPTRKWRFDFALPDKKIAFEIEGGTYSNGRHSRGAGYAKDCEKYNEAALMGWRVIRLPSDLIKPDYVENLIKRIFNDYFG